MLTMLKYPEVKKKCQEELDAVVGRSRMPAFPDKEHLPYIAATVRPPTSDRPMYGGMSPEVTPAMDPEIYGPDRHIDSEGKLATALTNTKDADWKGTQCWLRSADSSLHLPIPTSGHVCPNVVIPCEAVLTSYLSEGLWPTRLYFRHVVTNSLFINIASILWALNECCGKREILEVYFMRALFSVQCPSSAILFRDSPKRARAIVALQANEAT
ncbi:hypothetical protein BDZ89DRAFT_1163464 [Hymenopellis radicata]|nr:hypothetical protein BDZ89DRAFT_1163464 [Hymenopellis radicata]